MARYTRQQLETRLDGHSLLLRALVQECIESGAVSEQRIRERMISRGLTFKPEALRELLRMLKSA